MGVNWCWVVRREEDNVLNLNSRILSFFILFIYGESIDVGLKDVGLKEVWLKEVGLKDMGLINGWLIDVELKDGGLKDVGLLNGGFLDVVLKDVGLKDVGLINGGLNDVGLKDMGLIWFELSLTLLLNPEFWKSKLEFLSSLTLLLFAK